MAVDRDRWDVVVVGAGPSGSSCAYDLAKAGLSVLMVDKQEFPRDKPCGGGLTVKTLRRLRVDVSSVVKEISFSAEITDRMKVKRVVHSLNGFCSMVERVGFDACLKNAAVDVGACFRVISGVEEVRVVDGGVEIDFKGGEFLKASYLVAADGAKSAVRRLVHPRKVVTQAFAVEGKVDVAACGGYQAVALDFFVLPWGYGWVFPKGDHLNVGVGSWNRGVRVSRDELMVYCQAKLGHRHVTDIVGHPLGLGPSLGDMSVGRVLFIGDALGSVEPLLGEGIHNAVYSGQMAAKALVKGMVSPFIVRWLYRLLMWRQVVDVRVCWLFACLFYSFPRISYPMLAQPWFLNRLIGGYAKGKRLDRILIGL